MNKKCLIYLFYFSLVFCIAVSSHEDKIITLKNNELIGLPQQYQPAYLDIQNRLLRIKSKQINFSPCISKYFPDDNQFDIKISSSWYHDLSIMPPYISILIQPKGKDYSFDLLFNMDTLKPFEIKIVTKESNKVTSWHKVLNDKK